jgi:hypothetical protein
MSKPQIRSSSKKTLVSQPPSSQVPPETPIGTTPQYGSTKASYKQVLIGQQPIQAPAPAPPVIQEPLPSTSTFTPQVIQFAPTIPPHQQQLPPVTPTPYQPWTNPQHMYYPTYYTYPISQQTPVMYQQPIRRHSDRNIQCESWWYIVVV